MKNIKKIINVGEDELSEEYDLDKIKFSADVFIYNYEDGGYDGSGFAVWRDEEKWMYHSFSHCSCYGPLDSISDSDNAPFSLEDLKKIINANYNDQYSQGGKVLDYLNKNYPE